MENDELWFAPDDEFGEVDEVSFGDVYEGEDGYNFATEADSFEDTPFVPIDVKARTAFADARQGTEQAATKITVIQLLSPSYMTPKEWGEFTQWVAGHPGWTVKRREANDQEKLAHGQPHMCQCYWVDAVYKPPPPTSLSKVGGVGAAAGGAASSSSSNKLKRGRRSNSANSLLNSSDGGGGGEEAHADLVELANGNNGASSNALFGFNHDRKLQDNNSSLEHTEREFKLFRNDNGSSRSRSSSTNSSGSDMLTDFRKQQQLGAGMGGGGAAVPPKTPSPPIIAKTTPSSANSTFSLSSSSSPFSAGGTGGGRARNKPQRLGSSNDLTAAQELAKGKRGLASSSPGVPALTQQQEYKLLVQRAKDEANEAKQAMALAAAASTSSFLASSPPSLPSSSSSLSSASKATKTSTLATLSASSSLALGLSSGNSGGGGQRQAVLATPEHRAAAGGFTILTSNRQASSTTPTPTHMPNQNNTTVVASAERAPSSSATVSAAAAAAPFSNSSLGAATAAISPIQHSGANSPLAAAAAVGEGNRGGGDSGDGDGGGGVTYKFVVERPTSISPLGIDVYAPRDAASLALGRVAVAAVVDGGAAHKAGLRAGDVLQSMHGQTVQVDAQGASLPGGGLGVALTILRSMPAVFEVLVLRSE